MGGVGTFVACGDSGGSGGSGGTAATTTVTATSGTNTTTTGSLTTTTGSTPATTGSDTTTTTGTAGGGGSTSTSTGTSMCSKVTTLHPPQLDNDAGHDAFIFCPFSAVDGGSNEYCKGGSEHCCEPGSGSASCSDIGTACTAGFTDWQCQDPVADCNGGSSGAKVCCAHLASIGFGDPGCGNFAHKFTGAKCEAAITDCTDGIVMCTSDGECPSGQTCIPFATKGAQVGGCGVAQ